MIPYFQRGDYGAGIFAGVAALAGLYAERFGFELTGEVPQPPRRADEPGNPIIATILFVLDRLRDPPRISGGRGRGGPPAPGWEARLSWPDHLSPSRWAAVIAAAGAASGAGSAGSAAEGSEDSGAEAGSAVAAPDGAGRGDWR